MKRLTCAFYSSLLVIVPAWLLCSCNNNKNHAVKSPTRVKTEIVSQGHGGTGQTYVGIVEENEATAVSFTGMGIVQRVLVSEGQSVHRGQLLAIMDDTQARNILTSAEAQMTQANDALQRYGMLHENGSLPEVQWVEIQSKVHKRNRNWRLPRKTYRIVSYMHQ